MRNKTTYGIRARLVDHDGSDVTAREIVSKTNGTACHSDSVLNYTELDFAGSCDLRGGFLRLVCDDKGRLRISVEIDAKRKLTRAELAALRDDFEGQITDGIGAGCFDELSAATGLSVEVKFPVQARCVQQEGKAWKPTATTQRGNERRIAAVKKLVDAMDAVAEKSVPKRTPARASARAPEGRTSANRPNLKKLFRLLAKVERDQLFDQIKAELEASGNDLSGVVDGEYPYGNFRDPKLLRLVLKAGLRPETLDEKGHTMLFLAACSPRCIEVMLKLGVDVNRTCTDYYRATALMRAASVGGAKAVQLLLDAGADPAIKDVNGKTALEQVDDLRSRDSQKVEILLREAT